MPCDMEYATRNMPRAVHNVPHAVSPRRTMLPTHRRGRCVPFRLLQLRLPLHLCLCLHRTRVRLCAAPLLSLLLSLLRHERAQLLPLRLALPRLDRALQTDSAHVQLERNIRALGALGREHATRNVH